MTYYQKINKLNTIIWLKLKIWMLNWVICRIIMINVMKNCNNKKIITIKCPNITKNNYMIKIMKFNRFRLN